LNDRSATHKRADAFNVESCGHDEDPQVLTQTGLDIEGQRQPEISVERALMKFVEYHRRDIGKLGIIQNHPGKYAFRYHLDPGF